MAKGIHKDAHNEPATSKNFAPKKLPKQSSSLTMEVAHSVSEPLQNTQYKKNVQADPEPKKRNSQRRRR